ncbi:MAG TPA: aminopeptidase N [Gammaproteobacteria bacterium]|nr:aminopeptidase N [Gammaproteobacteria bacterium]
MKYFNITDTELTDITSMQPKTIHLSDYQPPAYFIDEIHMDFDLGDDETIVKSQMYVRRNRHHEGVNELRLNGEDLIIQEIKLDGAVLEKSKYEITKEFLIIRNVPDMMTLEITTKIFPQKNTALSGLYRSSNTFCTQCEAEGFRRITYYPDQPDILAKFTVTIHADAKKYPHLLSNGNQIASGISEKGRHWVKWEDPFKKPCYLFALVAGDFDLLEGEFVTMSQRKINLRIYVEKGYIDQARHALYSLQEAMRWDEEAFAREYDLDVYMIVAIGDFNMGAMENKGLNIFNTKYVLAKPETATDDDYIHILSVIGHEYFHNWSGNRVTCRDWFQLSLKEGLTIFRDQSFTEDVLSQAVMRIRDVNVLRESQFPEDAGPLAHPVRPESYIEINNFYTATVYNKGAEVLRMLQTILGRQMFRKGMDLYFAKYDGQAVTIDDFIKTMEDVSGLDLQQFRLWYTQAGTPVVTVKDEYDAQHETYSITVSQMTPSTPGQTTKYPVHVPIRMGLLDQSGASISLQLEGQLIEPEKILHLTTASQQFQFHHVKSKPIPSLLRGFSAPVKLEYDYTREQLLFLFQHDKDEFNRWEAGQLYAVRTILDLIKEFRKQKTLRLDDNWATAFIEILSRTTHDQFLLAEMLIIPSENYIGEQMEVIDVEAIHAVREFVLDELAKQMEPVLTSVYERCHETSAKYEFNMKDVGRRQLKNRVLSYLARLPSGMDAAFSQFEKSYHTNMTDAAAALRCLVNSASPQREKALQQFFDAWQKDALVIDKWFALQATSNQSDTLSQVKQLTKHSAFDIKNPNKVYSLIGAFSNRNPACFHVKTGEGYVFLREIVQQLDKLNPLVAARTVKPLTTWRRYDKERQQLMRNELQTIIKDKNISNDMYELVSKSLKEGLE